MNNLIDIQEKFNNVFDFPKLKENTKKYIERVLTESDDEFFFDYGTNKNEIQDLRKMRIDYELTQINLNREGSMPCFSLKYYLYCENEVSPQYTYEVEYNLNGEFLDEYFLKF